MKKKKHKNILHIYQLSMEKRPEKYANVLKIFLGGTFMDYFNFSIFIFMYFPNV